MLSLQNDILYNILAMAHDNSMSHYVRLSRTSKLWETLYTRPHLQAFAHIDLTEFPVFKQATYWKVLNDENFHVVLDPLLYYFSCISIIVARSVLLSCYFCMLGITVWFFIIYIFNLLIIN